VSETPSTRPTVLVVGDSLAVGMQPSLGPMLRPREVVWDAGNGRTTPEGLRRLRADLRSRQPESVVFSLGTNDGSDPGRFSSRIGRALAAVPADACVVWANIYRPPRKGAYHALNRVLERWTQRDARLSVVDWDRAVTSGRVGLRDDLHPDVTGYRYRSAMIAAAVARGCPAQVTSGTP